MEVEAGAREERLRAAVEELDDANARVEQLSALSGECDRLCAALEDLTGEGSCGTSLPLLV
jgi:hypothetical protein